MSKTVIYLLIAAILLILWEPNKYSLVQAQGSSCIPLHQSCDETVHCCGTTNRCVNNYCEDSATFNAVCIPDPPTGSCDNSHPCCDTPSGQPRICDAGYCRDNFPAATSAPVPSTTGLISNIGDLNIGESKEVTVSGLTSGSKYYWQESKLTSVIPNMGYTKSFADCHIADSSGTIKKEIGPFSLPGVYKVEIFNATTSTRCESIGNPINSKEFSVGGPTGQSCCEGYLSVYDRSKDVCKKDLISIPLQSNPEAPTKCTDSGTYCEPESLQCFNNKTPTLFGKICKDPKDPDFDGNKHTVCTKAGGDPCKTPTASDNPGFNTAIGCIHTSPAAFVKDFLTFIVAISGGLAFLMMLLGSFQMLTSAGNPETLATGRDRFTNAIIGLLFVIFSVLLMQIIGFDILRLPGFDR